MFHQMAGDGGVSSLSGEGIGFATKSWATDDGNANSNNNNVSRANARIERVATSLQISMLTRKRGRLRHGTHPD